MSAVTHYVAGLAFCPYGKHVALIRKRRPVNQAGLLNGIGGKVEPGETPEEAMVREFKEETTVDTAAITSHTGWVRFGTQQGPGWRVHWFCLKAENITTDFELYSATDEPVAWEAVHMVAYRLPMPELPGLIELARARLALAVGNAGPFMFTLDHPE